MKRKFVGLIGAGAAILMITSGAVAGSVPFKNCSNKPVWAKAFNSNDGFMLIASAEGCVQPSESKALQCATSSCKITVNYQKCETFQPVPYGTFSGPVIFWGPAIGGRISPGSTCP
jgi:hypothetical protein